MDSIFSVTENPCECDFLEQAAHDPDHPIVFNRELNEYHLEYQIRYGEEQSTAMMMVYHCPFCGGVAPPSQREQFFAQVSAAEKFRLQQLTQDAKSLNDVIERFGKPDQQQEEGFGIDRAETENAPPRAESFRTLTYRNLSEVAELLFVECSHTQIHVVIQPKSLEP